MPKKILVMPEFLDREPEETPYNVTHVAKNIGEKGAEAHTSRLVREFTVSGRGEQTLGTINHEMGHLIFSPDKPPVKRKSQMYKFILQAIEDARINTAQRRAGNPVNFHDDESVRLLLMDLRIKNNFFALMSAISLIGSDMESIGEDFCNDFLEVLGGSELYNYVRDAMNNPDTMVGYAVPFSETQRITQEIVELLKESDSKRDSEGEPGGSKDAIPGKGSGGSGGGEGSASKLAKAGGKGGSSSSSGSSSGGGGVPGVKFKPGAAPSSRYRGKLPSTSPAAAAAKGRVNKAAEKLWEIGKGHIDENKEDPMEGVSSEDIKSAIESGREENEPVWAPYVVLGINEFETKPIATALKQSSGKALSRCAPEGSVIRRLDRLYSDGYVFRAPVKNRKGWAGGSIMIDFSGSMGLSLDQIMQAIKRAPYKTKIYGYAGPRWYFETKAGRPIKSYEGVIFCISDGRRCITPSERFSDFMKNLCPNRCDGPALEFLNKLPGPRLWISDAGIYGVRMKRSRGAGLTYSTSECSSYRLRAHCSALGREGNIKRVNFGDYGLYIKTGNKVFLTDKDVMKKHSSDKSAAIAELHDREHKSDARVINDKRSRIVSMNRDHVEATEVHEDKRIKRDSPEVPF